MVNEILPSLSNEISKNKPIIGLKSIIFIWATRKAHNSKMMMSEISSVFEEWIRWLYLVFESGGEYVQ